jgi:multicomponent Na+:H+ antiporter subunit F
VSFGEFETNPFLINVIYIMLGVAFFLSFLRLVRGPSLPDRVVALDLTAALTVGIICTYAIGTNQRVFLDVAIVLALITFLGTIAFGQYVERRAMDD